MKKSCKKTKKLLGFLLSMALILQSSGVQVLAAVPEEVVQEDAVQEDAVSGNAVQEDVVSGDAAQEDAVSGNSVQEDIVQEDGQAEDEQEETTQEDAVQEDSAISAVDEEVSADTGTEDGADKESGLIASGTDCGLEWSISSAGELTISGEYNGSDHTTHGGGRYISNWAWANYRAEITSATVTATGIKFAQNMFSHCSNLKSVDFSNFDTSQITNMSYMFYGCGSLTTLDLRNFDTSQVTDMSYMFYGCISLTTLDLRNFDTSQVTNMSYMFSACNSLTTLDLRNFDTSQVTDMSYMFGSETGCYYVGLVSLNLSSFNTSQVTDMSYMFAGCNYLTTLDLSNFDTSAVTNMVHMFCYCTCLTTLDLSSFDTSKVTDMSEMFMDCISLTTLDLSSFDTSKVTDVNRMFYECYSLTTLDLSSFDFSSLVATGHLRLDMCPLLEIWTPKNLHCLGFELLGTYQDESGNSYTELPINLQSSIYLKVSDGGKYYGMDWSINSDGELTISGKYNLALHSDSDTGWWDYEEHIRSVTVTATGVTSTRGWFEYCSNLKSVDLSNFDTSAVTDMSSMFKYCYSLTTLDLGSFDTSAVTSMNQMFYGCSSLSSLDLSNFDTSAVTSMNQMFYGCSSLRLLDLSSFDTSAVTNMCWMFRDCSSLSSLDLSNFDTSAVTNMGWMFMDCSSLGSLDLSNFDTSAVTEMSCMFTGCSSLKKLNLSSFDYLSKLGNVRIWNLDECTSLQEIQTPKNLSISILLPVSMKDDSGEVYTELPQGLTTSIRLTSVDASPETEPKEKTYQIVSVPDQTYTGKELTPKVMVTDGEQILKVGVDYSASYANNVNAAGAEDDNAPTVTVKFLGSHSGNADITAHFTIQPKTLRGGNTTVSSMFYQADGKVKKPVPTVTTAGVQLAADKDYTVEYPDTDAKAYQEPGSYQVVIRGKGNYRGSIKARLVILGETDITASQLKVAAIPTYTYEEGTPATPTPKVTYKGKQLTLGVDYAIAYRDNDRAGKATLIITGLENVKSGGTCVYGTVEKTFTIKATALRKAKVTYSNRAAFTGSAIRPAVVLKVGETTLRYGTDYTVSYKNNINAGKGTIILTGCGGYTGTVKKTFTIQPMSVAVDELEVTLSADAVSFEQSGASPELTVKVGTVTLTRNRDYTVTYKNNKKLRKATDTKAPTAVIKGKGNYKFQQTVTFSIVEKALSDADIKVTAADKFIGGKGSLLSVPMVTDAKGKKLKAKRDYTIEGYYYLNGEKFDGSDSDNIKAGTTITVKIQGIGNYTGTAETTYHFAASDIAKAANVVVKPQTYSGSAVVFTEEMIQNGAVKVTNKTTGKALTYGTDYTITDYKNNVKKGTATMTIHGIGENYGGTKNVKFKIVAQK